MKTSALALIASIFLSTAVSAQEYDLVINNGRVMDPETMFDDIANVGIKDGRIAVITKDKIRGKQTINAKGLVVAPGFFDTHFHAVDIFGTKLGVADGITTGMDLEAGAMPVGEWYARKESIGSQVNYGTIVVNKGEVLPVRPGQPIRFPVEDTGRFEPVSVNKWLGEFAINVPDMHELDDTGAERLMEEK